MEGLGSLITFQGLSEGILNTGATIIRQAYELQNAAHRAADDTTTNNAGLIPTRQLTEVINPLVNAVKAILNISSYTDSS